MKPRSNPFILSIRSSTLAASAVLFFSGLASQSLLADATWIGDSTQDWNTAANWSSDPANPTGNFFVNTATTGVFPILSANSTFTPVDLIMANGGTTTARFDHRAGTVALANVTDVGTWAFIGRGANTATAIYNLANTATADAGISGFAQGSGSLTVGKLWVGGGRFFEGGTGTVNINTTGTLTANSTQEFTNSRASISLGYGTGSAGTINLQNGTVQANSEIWVGYSAAGTFNQSGGTVNSTEYFVVGRGGGAVGNYNLTGGTVNAATTLAGSFAVLGSFGGSTGTLDVSGTGTFNVGNSHQLIVGEGGNGTLNVAGTGLVTTSHATQGLRLGANATGVGVVNLNGGTIQTTLVTNGTGSGTFNFNGGTLKAAAASGTFMTGLSSAIVQSGGGTINSNGFDITIAQDLQDGGGGLTKTGAGTLTLSGANAFTGPSAVSAGTLAFSTKASLIGNVSVATGAGVRVQTFNSGTTPLEPANLTLATGSTLTFDFNSLDSLSPSIFTGALAASGTVNVSILNGANLTAGAHTLIDYGSFTGGGTFTGSPFTLGTRSSGTLATVGTSLVLNVTGNAPRWSGQDNGNWMVGSTGTNGNWRLITGGNTTNYIQGDTVLFNDLASGSTNVTISAADVTPASTVFDNTSKSYTLGGAFAIAGTGPLTKTGSGSLLITNANTYTGVTTIDADATLTLGDGTTGRDGTIAGTSSVVNNGTLVYNRFGTSTGPYPISGNGVVNVKGAGTQVLSGTNTWTGGTNVTDGGNLSIATLANLGLSPVLLDNGTLTTTNTDRITNSFITLTVGSGGGRLHINSTGAGGSGQVFLDAAGTLLGSGALTITGSGTLNATGSGNFRVGNTNSYNGAITLRDGGSFEYGIVGAVDAAATISLGNEGEVIANNNVVPLNIAVTGGTNSTLGFGNGNASNYSGTIVLNATGTAAMRDWYNPAVVRNGEISGAVGGAAGLTVNSGTGNGGILTLSNAANTYAGGTTLVASRVLAGTSGSLGSGGVTIGGSNAQLHLADTVSISNAITINAGAGTTAQGIIWVPAANANATVTGPITINAAQGAGGHFAANGGRLTVTGQITSSVPVSTRLGTVVLTNTGSTYTQLNAQQGTVQIGATNAIPVGATVDIGLSGAAALDLAGFNQTLAGVSQNVNAATITNSGASDSTLTTTGTATFAGVIQNGATHKTLLNVGSGALTLSGANTFTGNVTVSGGLTLADNGQLRFTPGPNTLVNSINGAGSLTLDGDFVIDTTGASVANGNTWTLVNVGTLGETFGPTFSVVDFTEAGNVWTRVDGANTWTFSEATGVLTLTVGTASQYDAWALSKGLTGANNGAAVDAEFDGISNALEFVLGGNPLASDTLTLPVLTTTATDFIYTFNRADESEAEIGLTFQHGSNLTGWTDVAIGATSAGVVVVTENAAAPDTVVVTIPKSAATSGKLFGRLRAVK